MDAKKVLVNGESLDVILRHYYAIGILIDQARDTRMYGGWTALQKWDKQRAKQVDDIKIEIELSS